MTEQIPQQSNINEPQQKDFGGQQRSDFAVEIFNLFKVKYKTNGTYGGKIIFISIISIAFLTHAFYILKVQFVQSIIVVCLLTLLFIILWKFGCAASTCETDFTKDKTRNA